MKLLRYGQPGQERPGLPDSENRVRDLSGHIDDISAQFLTPETLARLGQLDFADLPLVTDNPRLGPCVGQVGNFHCIGLNYRDHAEEAGMPIPSEPILFSKSTACISGPNDNIVIPPGSEKTDWEVELGIVMGSRASGVTEAIAMQHVAGYCVVNDLSERAFQLEGSGQWIKGKSADSFGPIGPWLVTADDVSDPQSLALWLEVDGRRYQDGTTANMIFGVAFLVCYISRYMTLLPGDIIATGTPAGVGLGRKPPLFLRPENSVQASVQGLGIQRQTVVQG